MTDVSWYHRFQKFQEALALLNEALETMLPGPSLHSITVQRFDNAFNLAFEVLSEYLETQGLHIKSHSSVFKGAFHLNIIHSFCKWMQGFDDINLMTHVYDNTTASRTDELIRFVYYPMLESLLITLEEQLPKVDREAKYNYVKHNRQAMAVDVGIIQ